MDDDGLAAFRFTAMDFVSKTLVLIPSTIFPLVFGVYKAFDWALFSVQPHCSRDANVMIVGDEAGKSQRFCLGSVDLSYTEISGASAIQI